RDGPHGFEARTDVGMKIAIAVALMAVVILSAPAWAFTEADIMRLSKFCETKTRLPWGDVDNHAWGDCLKHEGLVRPREVREKDNRDPQTPWMRALDSSLLWATEDGCEAWAAKQPTNPSDPHRPGVWAANRPWNLCMETARIFSPANRP